MPSCIFPKQFDNSYRGYKIAIVVLAFVVLARLAGFISAVGGNPWASTRFMLQRGDGVPLDSFSTAAAETVILLFVLAMLRFLLLGLLGLIVLIRYRSMIPLMFLFLFIDEAARKTIVAYFGHGGSAVSTGFVFNLAFLMVIVIGFGLSISTPRRKEQVAVR